MYNEKDELNAFNVYNQNFSGVYCTCHRPYPDPEDKVPDEMIQCVVCEDWYHCRHLGIPIPDDNYAEMICADCVGKHKFLLRYEGLSLKKLERGRENDDVDVVGKENRDVRSDDEEKENDIGNKEEEDVKSDAENIKNNEGNAENNEKDIRSDEGNVKSSGNNVENNGESVGSNEENIRSNKGSISSNEDNLRSNEENERRNMRINEEIVGLNYDEEHNEAESNEGRDNLEDGSSSKKEKITLNGNETAKFLEDDKTANIIVNVIESDKVNNIALIEVKDHSLIVDDDCSLDDKIDLTLSDPLEIKPDDFEDAENCCTKPKIQTKDVTTIFWKDVGWRASLCRCKSCMRMYEEEKVLFLLDLEDTVQLYEEKGKAKGLEIQRDAIENEKKLLNSLDRVPLMETIAAYNDLKENLSEYLKKFAENKKVVREEDIREFFSKLDAKKKQKVNNVYFCR